MFITPFESLLLTIRANRVVNFVHLPLPLSSLLLDVLPFLGFFIIFQFTCTSTSALPHSLHRSLYRSSRLFESLLHFAHSPSEWRSISSSLFSTFSAFEASELPRGCFRSFPDLRNSMARCCSVSMSSQLCYSLRSGPLLLILPAIITLFSVSPHQFSIYFSASAVLDSFMPSSGESIINPSTSLPVSANSSAQSHSLHSNLSRSLSMSSMPILEANFDSSSIRDLETIRSSVAVKQLWIKLTNAHSELHCLIRSLYHPLDSLRRVAIELLQLNAPSIFSTKLYRFVEDLRLSHQFSLLSKSSHFKIWTSFQEYPTCTPPNSFNLGLDFVRWPSDSLGIHLNLALPALTLRLSVMSSQFLSLPTSLVPQPLAALSHTLAYLIRSPSTPSSFQSLIPTARSLRLHPKLCRSSSMIFIRNSKVISSSANRCRYLTSSMVNSCHSSLPRNLIQASLAPPFVVSILRSSLQPLWFLQLGSN